MSRLGLGLGLSRGRAFSPFDPLSLNPIIAYEMHESMMAPLASESLDLNPAVSSTLDVITATRAGTATYTDASGNIQTASPNTVRVDHVQGEELTPTKFQRVGYTDFSSGWSPSGDITVSNAGSYEGFAAKRVSGNGIGLYFHATPVSNATQYTATFYARLISGSSSDLKFYTSSTTVVYTPITLTSEWQKFTKVITTTGTSVNFGFRNSSSSSQFVLEISQPQLEEGTTASDFVENTTGSPKFFAAATYADRVPMMLIEPAATNLVNYSEAIGSNGFSEVGTTIDSNVTVSPDGTASADLLKETDASGSHFMYKDLTLSSGQAYTISVFAKRNGVDRDLRFGDGGLGWSSGFLATFDLTEGTATGGGTIENIGNDWYRCSVTGTTNATTARLIAYSTLNGATSYQGDGESGIYLWGFQVETGTVATSYIPTSGSAVTRAADDLVIDGSDFTDFWNATEGTVYVEATAKESGPHYIFSFNNGSYFESLVSLFANYSNLLSYSGGVNESNIDAGVDVTTGVISRFGLSISENNFKISIDGGTPVTDTSCNVPDVNKLNIGANSVNSFYLNGHIKRLIYWPHHSDNL